MKKGKTKKILLTKDERASLGRVQTLLAQGIPYQEAIEVELLLGNLDKKFRFHRVDVWRVSTFIERGKYAASM